MQMRTSALQKKVEAEAVFDTHPEVSLDFKYVQAALKEGYTKPFLLVDSNLIRNKARRFKATMPLVHPHYAVKANPDPRVLRTMIEEGVGFEIASISELDLLLSLGVPAAEVYYSNPMKVGLIWNMRRPRASNGTCWIVSKSYVKS